MELYTQLHSPSIMGCYNNTGKNAVCLINLAQKYKKIRRIFEYASKTYKQAPERTGIVIRIMRIKIRQTGKV